MDSFRVMKTRDVSRPANGFVRLQQFGSKMLESKAVQAEKRTEKSALDIELNFLRAWSLESKLWTWPGLAQKVEIKSQRRRGRNSLRYGLKFPKTGRFFFDSGNAERRFFVTRNNFWFISYCGGQSSPANFLFQTSESGDRFTLAASSSNSIN